MLTVSMGVYKITNTKNGKCYIGSALDIKRRWKKHQKDLKNGTHHSLSLQRAWNKYGEASFVFDVMTSVKDRLCLLGEEQYFIDKFNSAKVGYNIAPIAGSPLGVKHTATARQRMSDAKKGSKHTEEAKGKISVALLGNKRSLGYHHTEDARGRISTANTGKVVPLAIRLKIGSKHKGKKLSEDHKEKLLLANKGRKLTEEHKRRIGLANIGNKHRAGKRLSKEHKKRISQFMKGNTLREGRTHTTETREKMSSAVKEHWKTRRSEVTRCIA